MSYPKKYSRGKDKDNLRSLRCRLLQGCTSSYPTCRQASFPSQLFLLAPQGQQREHVYLLQLLRDVEVHRVRKVPTLQGEEYRVDGVRGRKQSNIYIASFTCLL